MAPKKRQSRMHAAIDAMRPFGFSSKTVQATVKALLKEYGGDDNWPFIEADAYSILISSILEQQEVGNEREKSYVGENLLEANGEGADIAIKAIESDSGPSKLVLSPICSMIVDTTSPSIQTAGNENEESSQIKKIEKAPITSPRPKIPKFSMVKTLKPKSENMNGWLIEDDDDDYGSNIKINRARNLAPLKRKHSDL